MSWDILVLHAEEAPLPLDDMPSDWEPALWGTAGELQALLTGLWPGTSWSDDRDTGLWGFYDGPGYSFEFHISNGGPDAARVTRVEDDTPVYGVSIQVRGGGAAAADLARLTGRPGWYALDIGMGTWFHHTEDPARGFERFQRFRDTGE